MKLVYSHPNFSQVALLRSALENAGIAAVIRNEHLSPLVGKLPAGEVWPELWVNEGEFDRAEQLLLELSAGSAQEPWTCPRCGARNEGNMALCWQCDYAVDGE